MQAERCSTSNRVFSRLFQKTRPKDDEEICKEEKERSQKKRRLLCSGYLFITRQIAICFDIVKRQFGGLPDFGNAITMLFKRERDGIFKQRECINVMQRYLPNSNPKVFDHYNKRAYSGQFRYAFNLFSFEVSTFCSLKIAEKNLWMSIES